MPQMPLGPVMLDLVGPDLTAEECELLLHPLVGGVIFFARNYSGYQQMQTLVRAIRSLRPNLLLAVDQEGGRVQRFHEGFTVLPAAWQLADGYDSEPVTTVQSVTDTAWLMASELLALGLDFSFAPVLDIHSGQSIVIGDRSFGDTPEKVIALAGAYIKGMHEAGMATTGKHYPGHGSVMADSHHELPVDGRPCQQIFDWDERPFKALKGALDGIMPAHIHFPAVDSHPVGFSRHWLGHRLRGELGYEGVIFSDDLTMEGAGCAGSYGDRAEQALAAGCDMVLVCNNRQGAVEVLERLAEIHVPSDVPRLSVMAARKTITQVELLNSNRWQRTHQWLQDLATRDSTI